MTTQVASIHPPRYPAFGIPCGNPEKLSSKINFLQRSITCLSLAGVIAAFAVTAPIFYILGIISAVALVAMAAIKIYAKLTEHQRKLNFEGMQVPTNGVPLGRWTQNNDVIVSNRVDESFQFKKALLRQAKKSIEISFNFGGGQAFRDTLAIIDERMRLYPDLKVHILVSNNLLGKNDCTSLAELKAKYSERFQYLVTRINISLNPYLHSSENHCKMLIVDGKYFVTGGSGIDDRMVREQAPQGPRLEYQTIQSRALPDSFRDTDVVGRGSLGSLMREQFFRLYGIWEYKTHKNQCNRYFETDGTQTSCPEVDNSDKLIINTKAKFLVSGPEHRTNNPIVAELAKRVNKAHHEIVFANSTFVPPKKLRDALSQKLKNNVSVTGVFAGITPRDYISCALHTWQSRSHYDLVSQVYEHQNPGQFYHKKVCLFDNRYSMVGTVNISIKSCTWDYEDALFFDDQRVNLALKNGIEQDKLGSRHLNGEKLAKVYKSPFTQLKATFLRHVYANMA